MDATRLKDAHSFQERQETRARSSLGGRTATHDGEVNKGVISATLALLEEQKRTNRLLHAQILLSTGDISASELRDIDYEMGR